MGIIFDNNKLSNVSKQVNSMHVKYLGVQIFLGATADDRLTKQRGFYFSIQPFITFKLNSKRELPLQGFFFQKYNNCTLTQELQVTVAWEKTPTILVMFTQEKKKWFIIIQSMKGRRFSNCEIEKCAYLYKLCISEIL